MQTNIHNKKQTHDPYARNHPTEIVIYTPKAHNQKAKHKEGTMKFLASATLGAVTGNGIARYNKINRPIRFKHDAMPILAGTAIPTIISVASGLQPTGLKLLGAGVTSAIIAYSMTPSDPVAEDKKTDNPKADAPKPVPTVSNNQPQTTPISIDNPHQTEQNSQQAIPTTTTQKPQNNINNPVTNPITTENNTQKSLPEQAFDFFSNLFATKQPKPKKEKTPKQEAKHVPLTAHQKELQEYEREEREQAERQKQQAEALERELAYMQTDEYKEKQRLEAEAKKRAEAEAEEARRQASKRFDARARQYFAERNRKSQRHQNPNQGIAGQPPIRPMLDVQQLLTNATTPQRRAEINNALDALKPYHKDKANTIQEIIQKVLPHNDVTSEEDFNKIQSKNVRTLQNLYHPNKINNLSVPQDKQADLAKQLDIISGFITNLRNITYHFQLRDQTE